MQYGLNSEGPPPRTWVNLPLVVALIVVGILGVWLITEKSGPVYNPEAAPREPASRGSLMEIEQTTNALYEKVKTSVVYITTLVRQSDLFRLNVSEIPQGAGSGFIWDSDGHIVTNFHVIMDAMQSRQQVIRVTLADRTAWDAKIVGFDPEMDLAVLHIEAPSSLLKPIPLGTSNDLLGARWSLPSGIPSGTTRH